MLFQQYNAPYYKSIATRAKLHELHFKLLPQPPYSLDLVPSNCWLFADLKRMLQGKRFGSIEEVISETEAYFEANDKSFYKKSIELLEKRWNQCITLETMLMNKFEFSLKVVVLLFRLGTNWVMYYFVSQPNLAITSIQSVPAQPTLKQRLLS